MTDTSMTRSSSLKTVRSAGRQAGPMPPPHGSGTFAMVRTRQGTIVGLWFAGTEQARDRGLVQAVLFREDLLHLIDAESQVVPNTVDDRGGAFVMFGRPGSV